MNTNTAINIASNPSLKRIKKELIEDEDAPGRVTEWLNPKTNPCAGRQGQRFGTDQHLYVRAPSCVNRLSSFKQGGKYLACDSQSTTYASCGRTLSGTGSMPFPPPLNGVRPSSRKSGGYSLCTAPSGSRTVNQLREYNEQLAATMNGTANGTAAGMAEAQNQIDNQVAQQGADCSKSGLAVDDPSNTTTKQQPNNQKTNQIKPNPKTLTQPT